MGFMDMHERLRQARLDAGYSSAADAARTFGWEIPSYRSHENGTRAFDIEAAKRYGRAFRVNPGWLLALDKIQYVTNEESRERIVEVIGSVAAGVWKEATEWPQSDRFEIVVGPSPIPNAKRFGLRLDGYSMDQVFPPGTLLDCLSIFDVNVEPETGDIVIVERIREDGKHELTVKEYQRDDDGRAWLLPRSSKPEFQAPIEVGQPDEKHDGNDSVRIIAYVIGSYQPRATRFEALAKRGI